MGATFGLPPRAGRPALRRAPATYDEPMRPVIITANWKMNTSPADAGPLARSIADATRVAGVTRIICPPFVCLAAVGEALAGTDVAVGAQNVHTETKGAYTGEIAAAMLTGLATWAIVGHSERRRDQAETDEQVGHKIVRLVEAGIHPMMCCGEQLEEREAGRAVETVQAQVKATLETVLAAGNGLPSDLVIAYEPVWAIGTGKTATGADAAEMATAIRATIADVGGAEYAESVPVLYGGSVTADSFPEFIAEPTIDGALIGGAGLKPDQMSAIAAAAAQAAATRAAA
jgi:triosephosphate isomerase (TIM)